MDISDIEKDHLKALSKFVASKTHLHRAVHHS